MTIISRSFASKALATAFVLASIGAVGCSSSPGSDNADEPQAGTSTEALSTGQYVVTGGTPGSPQGSYAWDIGAGRWIWIYGCSRLYYSPSSADWGYRCVNSGCHWYVRAWYYDGSKLVQIRTDHIAGASTVGRCG